MLGKRQPAGRQRDGTVPLHAAWQKQRSRLQSCLLPPSGLPDPYRRSASSCPSPGRGTIRLVGPHLNADVTVFPMRLGPKTSVTGHGGTNRCLVDSLPLMGDAPLIARSSNHWSMISVAEPGARGVIPAKPDLVSDRGATRRAGEVAGEVRSAGH